MRKLAGAFVLLSTFSMASEPKTDSDFDKWITSHYKKSKALLSQNISAKNTAPGTVLASPSRNEPDYYYHWVRDAGLTMSALVDTWSVSTDASEKQKIQQNLYDYWRLTLRHQTQNTLAGLGEVKFYVDGSAFTDPWGRPQNDGPAIRALSLIKWWETLKKLNSPVANHKELYTAQLPAISAIKRDLEYTSHHWKEANFDVWEEVKGDHFFTRLFQYHALKKGSQIALAFEDPNAALWYMKNAKAVKNTLGSFWNENTKIILSTLNRVGGIDYKLGLDSAILIAVLESQEFSAPNTTEWTVLDSRVQSTVQKLENRFKEVYKINSHLGDKKSPLIGRYPNDRYDGYRTDSAGNPWFLNTHYFAEFYYRLAHALMIQGELLIDQNSRVFWARFTNEPHLVKINSNTRLWKKVINKIIAKGDSFLNHTKEHTAPSGAMAEQINRNTGKQQGAHDLSWSYSSFIRAAEARSLLAEQ